MLEGLNLLLEALDGHLFVLFQVGPRVDGVTNTVFHDMRRKEARHELSLDGARWRRCQHAELSLEGACLRQPLVEKEHGQEEEPSGLLVALFGQEALTEPDCILAQVEDQALVFEEA